ncbi:MucR family transcriptional regulator [Pseudochelatococcus sp. B33]
MNPDIASATALIVSSYVANNTVPGSELPDLIVAVGGAIAGPATPSKSQRPEPAVPIQDSVTDDFIVCLEDGRKFKSLKRHLAAHYGLTPQQYRNKWGLSADYPMVAPSYAAHRADLARKHYLGIPAWRRAS